MIFRFLLLCLLALSEVAPSRAQNATPVENSEAAPVRVEGRRIFDVGPRGSASGVQRASRIERRLNGLIESETPIPPFSPSDVKARNGEEVVFIGAVEVLEVTRADALDAGQNARELALIRGAALSRAARDARATRQNPLRGAAILMGQSLRELLNSFWSLLPRVFAAILLGLVFWMLAKFARRITQNATKRFDFDSNLRDLVLALSFYGVWFVGTLAILSALGLDSSSLATAVGVSGFVLGFAFKDILSHFLAGILLLVSGKFRIGDQIVVREFEGTVERIELRALELRTYDNRLVIIPNADVFAAPITSNTALPHRRRSFTVMIPHDADIERAQNLIIEAMRNTADVLDDPSPDVLVDDLTPTGTVLRARFSTQSTRSDFVLVSSECMKNVKIALQRAGLGVPCPPEAPPSATPSPRN